MSARLGLGKLAYALGVVAFHAPLSRGGNLPVSIEVPCSGCGRTLRVGPEHAGKMARCPVCSHITLVPTSGENAAVTAAEVQPAPLPSPATWHMRTPEAQEYGPATRGDLDRWLAEGRIAADCFLRDGEQGEWQSADRIFPELTPAPIVPAPIPVPDASAWVPPTPIPNYAAAQSTPFFAGRPAGPYPAQGSAAGVAAPAYQTPHRGALILVLGLLGLFIQCPVFSVIAWVMGSNDLREMEAGRMDRSGMDLTRAGMILGMALSILWILAFLAIAGIIFLINLAG